jgi:hypothetical protein
MRSGNLARMGNIAAMDHTSTKSSGRLERGRSPNRVIRNTVPCSREQSLKPRQGNRAPDQDRERPRLLRSTLRRVILLRIHTLLYNDIERMMVQQTTPVTLLR